MRCAVSLGLVATVFFVIFATGRIAAGQYPSGPQIIKDGTAVLLQDYASLPLSSRTTGSYPPPIDFAGQLGRVNFLRSEPANVPQSSSRFFVNDTNRNLYILDKTTRTFTLYINFEEVFPKFDNYPEFAGGFVTFAFDPNYAGNGKFYTIHTEDPNKSGSAEPTNTSLPGLDLSGGYTLTTAVDPPTGTVVRQAVLVEWTDTNRNDSTFEGTAREILRVGFNNNKHPMGDLLFNPLAQPGGADYGNLYIAVGDGGAGETYGAKRSIPQRLDALPGKILRITPDATLRPLDDLSPNGRYRIPTTDPDPNPFASLSFPGLRKEIYAYGFRNPHRMSWDSISDKLIVDDIGLRSWEEVDIVTKGSNHGYSEREGTEQLFVTNDSNNGKTGSQTSPPAPFPDPDSLTVTGLDTPVTPVYPVIQYSHEDGDAISGGFVYRGSLMPQLEGKYIFGDLTTARLFFADLDDMIAKDDGDRTSLAAVHELHVVFDDPNDNPDLGPVNRRLFDIVAAEYARKGGDAPGSSVLPGSASHLATSGNDPDGIPYGGGRADIRLALGGDGEIYVLSKGDGMIRQLVAVAVVPLTVTVAATDSTATEDGVTTGTFAVSRTGSTAASLTVDYTVSGAATPDGDYAALTGSVTIPAGAASATIVVTPIEDTAVEPDETVVVSLGPGAAYLVGTPGSATVTIVSDDAPPPSKDLVIEGLALSAGSVAAGSNVTASYVVANRGTVMVTETYTDRLYLSTDATLDAGDVMLGTSQGYTADLAPNATHAHSQAVGVPAGTAAGSYFLLVQADALAAVIETNEGNNVTAVALAVTPQTGLRSPTANAAAAGGDGNGFQSSPQNAYADDALNAVDTNSGTGSSTSCTGSAKDKHRFYNYGFTFPAGVSIRGIEVRLDAKVDGTSSSPKMCVQLSADGGSTWTPPKSTPTLKTSMTTFMLGSPTDTWGRSWTTDNFADANFRVRVINVSSSTSRDFSLDWVAVSVHYQ
jgi:hypothetical protein